jgi:hypothetical protein
MTDTQPVVSTLRLVKLFGTLGIAGGLLLILAGGVAWTAVSIQLRAENITVAEDASFLAGATVADPFTAYAEADVINMHAREASDGKTYAELDREDPLRATVMNASFLRTSLFTSVVAFGVAAFAIGVGALSVLFGWALRRLAS